MTTEATVKKAKTSKKATASEAAPVSETLTKGLKIPVTEQLPLESINLAAYNPRVMPKEKMDSLKASLRKHGLVLNLVVQKTGMVLIGGHQRIAAMRDLCKAEKWALPATVPAMVLDVSDAEAKQLNVSLNNIEGEFDPYKLGELFAGIRSEMTMDDVVATGFTAVQIDEAIALTAPIDEQIGALEDEAENMPSFANSITLSVEFATVDARDAAKELLKAAAKKMGRKAGDLVFDSLKAAKAAGKIEV